MVFLEEFPDYCETITDAPRQYKEEVAFDVLSCIVRRQVYLQWGEDRIYPNIYKIYIGRSTFFRKSTMLKIGKRFVEDILGFEFTLGNRFSYEGFVKFLCDNSTAFLHFDEFANLYELIKNSYTLSPEALLTELYDCPEFKRECNLVGKNGNDGTIDLKDIFLNIFGATTEAWLLKNLNESSIRGGFIPRFLFVRAKVKDSSMPIPSKSDDSERELLIGRLKEIQKLLGKNEPKSMVLSNEAKNVYVRFHELIEKKYVNADSLYSPFYNRALTYVLKYSMLISLDFENTLQISGASMEMAVIRINRLLNGFKEFVTDEITFTKYQADRKRVLDFMNGKGELMKSKLLQGLKIKARDLREILDTLIEEGTVLERAVINKGQHKKNLKYKLNENISIGS